MNNRILILIEHYLPGFKAGGPTRSIANLVKLLQGDYVFYIYTRDRDLGDTDAYACIENQRWYQRGAARVLYGRDRCYGFPGSLLVLRRVRPDVVYLNSVFCVSSLIVLTGIVLRLSPPTNLVVLAPRGEFAVAALSLKPARKRWYLRMANLLGLFDKVTWQASSSDERNDISRVIGPHARVAIVANVPDTSLRQRAQTGQRRPKLTGELDLACIARISSMKNHEFLLDALEQLNPDSRISLTLYGPVEDMALWEALQVRISRLPPAIRVRGVGSMPPGKLIDVFSEAHFHILPTRGENFGHSIFEALMLGCPVITSDRTPWTARIRKYDAGWALSLDSPTDWAEVLERCVCMSQTEHQCMTQSALALADDYLGSADCLQQHASLFGTNL